MAGRWQSLSERQHDLERLTTAMGLSAVDIRPRIDRLVAALLADRHDALAERLATMAYPPTWEGVAAAADALARRKGDAATVEALDEVLFRAMIVAVALSW
jgi:hypothetical protein